MKFTVEVFPAREVPEEPVVYENVDHVSFIDNDSHGPARNFGITDTMGTGKKIVFICAPNVLAATVERTD